MPTDIFQNVSMAAGDQKRSYQWYQTQVRKLGSNLTARQLMKNQTLTSRLMPGNMYLFVYDPKHKKTLPYYDTFPLVLPFNLVQDGFLGINLHYLPYMARFRLLGELSKLATDKSMSENTRIRFSWQLLNSSTKYLAATQCVKHYLKEHVQSSFLKISFTDWITASMLPIEGFRKENKTTVWREVRRNLNGQI